MSHAWTMFWTAIANIFTMVNHFSVAGVNISKVTEEASGTWADEQRELRRKRLEAIKKK